jgi:hypothetical protein
VDVYRLMIIPLVLGGGKRFLPDDGAARLLRPGWQQQFPL